MQTFYLASGHTSICFWVYNNDLSTASIPYEKEKIILSRDFHGRVEIHNSMLIVLTYEDYHDPSCIERDRADLESILNG